MKPDTETMKLKITATKLRQFLGYCAICAAVAFASVSANAQNPRMDMKKSGKVTQNSGLDMALLNAAFKAADTSGDGRIDEAELAADTVAAFVAVDDDGDDRVSAEELGGAGIDKLDVDKNKSLTIVEVMNAKLGEFQIADANGDGELTIDEISQYERRR